MRRAAKVDANQKAIVQALRARGATVQSLAAVGQGVPDLLVGSGGRNWLLEIKSSRGTLTAAESSWISRWRGAIDVVRTPEEALAIIYDWEKERP